MNQTTAARARAWRPGRWALGILLAVILGLGICEALGWPFLASPMQRMLSDTLARRVSFSADQSSQPKVLIHLLGGVKVNAAHIEIGAPAWSKEPYMLQATDARLTLGYADLWRASQGKPLRIRELRAHTFDSRIERLADGRASWQFGKKRDTPDTTEKPTALPSFGNLQVDIGTASYRDALAAADIDAKFSLTDSSPAPSPAAASAAAPALGASAGGLKLSAKGSYQKNPVTIQLDTNGVLQVLGEGAAQVALPVSLDARVGGAALTFRGTATDAFNLTALKGRFSVRGPSLAAVGDPLKVTLPTTGAFSIEGLIAKDGVVWNTVIDRATIGSSRLGGAFQYDPRPKVPVLSGRLTGSKLLLADLGPSVGTSAPAASGGASAPPAKLETKADKPAPATRAAAKTTNAPPKTSNDTPGRVLPDREFDLPSLRAMDANVLIAIDNLDLGSSFLAPLKPLKTHLVLSNGVLKLQEIDARTGVGRLFGGLQLDGREAVARWNADLGWRDIRLEQWIHQARGGDAPPYITGDLGGQARLAGQGKSTAAILGSLRGGVRLRIADGTISHLAVEGAGLDIAQGLGMFIKGDDSLPLQCTVVDFSAEQGVLKPRAFVIDTADSVLWVDGSVSLVTEGLDLKVTTSPKDFSPLAVRTPVRVRGTFANPGVSLDPSRLAPRAGVAVALAFINPLAALIPFIDLGDSEEAKKGSDACRELSRRIAARPSLPAPAPKPNAPGRTAKRG
jgi:AsmA family protein